MTRTDPVPPPEQPTPKNAAAERLRRKIKAAIEGMNRYWDSDDGDSDDFAAAMMDLRHTYARDLRAALAEARAAERRAAQKQRRDFEELRRAVKEYITVPGTGFFRVRNAMERLDAVATDNPEELER
jgi:hypothetical protein